MISILIPVYNVTIFSLVRELSEQLDGLGAKGEIIVFDDYSNDLFKVQNRSVTSLKHVFYKELEQNFGRSKIRYLLGQQARFNWLLFIDADSVVISKNYLKNFSNAIGSGETDVYVGGRVYQEQIPDDCNKRLHWKYGKLRESARGNSEIFHSNNFCIRKEVFLQLKFPSQITGYGHEDTWMEIELNKENKKISFIKNPVLHDGLEDSQVFLEKTKNALKNLLLLAEIQGTKVVKNKVGLYKLYLFFQKSGLTSFIHRILQKKIKELEKNLTSCAPSLFQFDLYRLCFLMEFANEKKEGR